MNAPELPVRQGDVLAGKYRVEKVLGIGGMGVVVAALHLELDQRVALKFLLPSAANKPEVIARFSREARAAAKIKSEHVARVSDVGTLDSGLPYIVMEYLDGGDLSERLADKGSLPQSVAVDYVLQACEAIAEAHAAGIVHRDLKPGNLFLARQSDGSEIIKVLDFGISKAVLAQGAASAADAKLTKTQDVFGSPMYMSPEQLKSARDVDPRADLWALGAILFELLTGKAPFERNTIAEIFGAILHERAPRLRDQLPSAPEELDRVLDRCLQKDPDRRFQHVAQLAQALLPFGSHASRPAAERAVRMARRSGLHVPSIPPPPDDDDAPISEPIPLRPAPREGSNDAAAATNLAVVPPASAASTRTSWGKPEGFPRARPLGRALLVGLAFGGAAALATFVFIRQNRPTQAATSTTAILDVPRPEPTPSVDPLASAAPSASVALSASALPSASVALSASAAPSASIAAVVPSAPLPPLVPSISASAAPSAPRLQGRLPPVPVTSAPKAPPPPPPEDPDDFGGRL
jgi:serine/threonine protein kinase